MFWHIRNSIFASETREKQYINVKFKNYRIWKAKRKK